MNKIIMFHGRECPHCKVMHPIVNRLIREGAKIEKLEVWHDEKNAEEMRKSGELIRKVCDGDLGTPTFLDKKKGRAICGEIPYEELKKWIKKG